MQRAAADTRRRDGDDERLAFAFHVPSPNIGRNIGRNISALCHRVLFCLRGRDGTGASVELPASLAKLMQLEAVHRSK